jgi:3'-phosphoadenosine 5'-phosphosulfate sulfotransferase (PAPS reductase)/FAD synthetase
MAICDKCIIPSTFPGVTMTGGTCSFCRDHEGATNINEGTKAGDQSLEELLKDRNPFRKYGYDCLVPFSGGKDSAYVLYYVVTQLKLKPFATFFDSGFTHELARMNVSKICTKLGVDWTAVKSPHNYRSKAIIEAIHMSKSIGRFFRTCSNCENNIRTMAINESLARGIPYIIWGSTDYEDAVERYTVNGKERKAFRHSFGNGGVLISAFRFLSGAGFPLIYKTPYRLIKYWQYITRDNFDIGAPGGLRKLNPLHQVPFNHKNVRVIYFFDHVKYNPLLQIETLRSELGWEAPTGRESRIDCKLHCLQNYSFTSRTGISQDGFGMANLVRNGLMDRADALRRESLIRERLEHECLETLKDLGFTDYVLEPLSSWQAAVV